MKTKVSEFHIRGIVFQAILGDISDSQMDVIVCPGNSLGLMRGGASQALRLKGGDIIEQAAKRCAPIRIGQAALVESGKLLCKKVIYAPAIVNPVDCASNKSVYAAARCSIKCALRNNLKTIAFPILGAGTGQMDFQTSCLEMLKGILSVDFNSYQIKTIGFYIRRSERYDILKQILCNAQNTYN